MPQLLAAVPPATTPSRPGRTSSPDDHTPEGPSGSCVKSRRHTTSDERSKQVTTSSLPAVKTLDPSGEYRSCPMGERSASRTSSRSPVTRSVWYTRPFSFSADTVNLSRNGSVSPQKSLKSLAALATRSGPSRR